jgi:hypothetical protein
MEGVERREAVEAALVVLGRHRRASAFVLPSSLVSMPRAQPGGGFAIAGVAPGQ